MQKPFWRLCWYSFELFARIRKKALKSWLMHAWQPSSATSTRQLFWYPIPDKRSVAFYRSRSENHFGTLTFSTCDSCKTLDYRKELVLTHFDAYPIHLSTMENSLLTNWSTDAFLQCEHNATFIWCKEISIHGRNVLPNLTLVAWINLAAFALPLSCFANN